MVLIQKKSIIIRVMLTAFLVLSQVSCLPLSNKPAPGRDKQSIGTWYGVATGAATGAVTGLNYSYAAGPGAWIGAGLGGIFGMFSGLGQDVLEEEQLRRMEMTEKLRQRVWVHGILTEHLQRRMALYPNRDIFPADLFFEGGGIKIRPQSVPIVQEIANLMLERRPWSKVVVATYVMSKDEDSQYARHLARQRAEEFAITMVRSGIDARRLDTKPLTIDGPIVLDPLDVPTRYAQAVELILVD